MAARKITSTSCDRDDPDGYVVWPCRVLPRTAVPTPGADRQTDRQGRHFCRGGTSAGEALTAAYPQPPQVCSRIPLYGAVCGLSSVVWERCNNVNKEGYLMPTPRTHSAYRHTLAPPMYRSKLAFFARRFVNIYICVGDVLDEHTEGHHLPTRTHGLNCCRVTEPSAAHPSSWPYRLGSSRPTLTPYTPNWYSPAQLNLPSANGTEVLLLLHLLLLQTYTSASASASASASSSSSCLCDIFGRL